jgi:type II secretory pathway pseudopilin PulG
MKNAVIGLLTALVAIAAQTANVQAKDATNLYQSISQENQTQTRIGITTDRTRGIPSRPNNSVKLPRRPGPLFPV